MTGPAHSTDYDRLWAVGRYDLGLGTEEFWSLTPRQFRLLVERKHEAERAEYWRAALGAWASIAPHTDPKKGRQPRIEDFIPDGYGRPMRVQPVAAPKKDPNELREWLRMMNRRAGGTEYSA